MINDSVNQTLSRTILASMTVWLVVIVLYWFGGEGIHLFAFVMVVGVIVGTYSSIYIASPLLLMFGEGTPPGAARERVPAPQPEGVRV
jgi:SecD/SecF fusion protein